MSQIDLKIKDCPEKRDVDAGFFAKMIPDTKSKALMGVTLYQIVPDSIIYSDGYFLYMR